ncbi:tyrosine-type recombinase/integrase [Peribacillus loiseleuriae]|uniref:Integrase n=1 Tax=Peribacillus loiseleuriae TaxID=1679170 RepID=A0A0K9GR72_9BACI|nr:tyrosine-type recombinase/integrase [Peribacillus loiseleuriae]KMY49194.1 hypothetical protein AC625_06390 [Peribacillus loiseleuriae]
MAYIEKRGKDKYRLTVNIGYDEKGTAIKERKTVQAKNPTEAKKLLSLFEAEILTGNYIKIEEKMTLNKFYPEWLNKYAKTNLTDDTSRGYSDLLKVRILPKYGHMKLTDIKTMHIVNFINDLKQDGQRLDGKEGLLSDSSISNCYKAFNNILACAYDWKLIKENPASSVKVPRAKRPKTEVYTREDLKQLSNLLEKEPFHWRVLVMLAITTGAREGEIAALEWKHIDFNKGTIYIEQAITEVVGEGVKIKSTKNGRERMVSAPSSLMIQLKQLKGIRSEEKSQVDELWEWKGHFFIFGNEFGKPIRPDSISKRWRRFTKRENFKHIRFHALRHTSATLLINEGVHAKVISERLGHSNISTTMNIYGHVLAEADQAAASHFDSFFEKKEKEI